MKKAAAFLLAFVIVLNLCACGQTGAETTTAPSGPDVPVTTSEILFPQSGDLDAVALSTEHFSFSKGEMVYLFALSVSDFLLAYRDYLSYIGLDPTTSFKNQQDNFTGHGGTWFDFFLEDARLYAEDYLVFCEAALAEGLSLTEEDASYIEAQKKTLEDEAATYGWDLETYLNQLYSTDLDWKYVESTYQKTRLAQKAYNHLIGEKSFTEEEIEQEYTANMKNYSLVDYYSVNFGDGENIPDAVLEKVRESLKTVKSYEDFYAIVKDFLLATRTTKTLEDAGGLDAYTEKYMGEALKKGNPYASSDLYSWAFDPDTAEGSIYTMELSSTQAPVAYYLLKKPYRDESVTVNVRHILFLLKAQGGTYETLEAAHAQAEKIYQQWIAEGRNLDSFVALCSQYSNDGNANSGGLYTNVKPGQMVKSFNDWCFDENRKMGDDGIVDTEFGSHIMLFEGRNIAWHAKAEAALRNAMYDRVCDEQAAKTPVTVKDEILKEINW